MFLWHGSIPGLAGRSFMSSSCLQALTHPNQTSAGIRYVIVNGVPVVSEGELIPDAKPGQPIRRPSVVDGRNEKALR